MSAHPPDATTRVGSPAPHPLREALSERYAFEDVLGSGGMATVYAARDLRHSRRVAIKVIHPEFAAALGTERFVREIEIAAALNHPHILPLFDSGDAGGYLHYVMPIVPGATLRDRLRREGQFTVADTIAVLRDIVDALAHAHQRGVVHRDIKPENVLMSERHALVADFGIARALGTGAAGSRLTTVGVTLGTPAYMAPEQILGDPETDHRVDLYAVGAVGYELLAGQPPFVRDTRQQVLTAHLNENPEPIQRINPAVPSGLATILHRCLEKTPSRRFDTAEDLLEAIQQLDAPRQRWQRLDAGTSGWAARLAIATALVGAAGGTAYYVNQPDTPAPPSGSSPAPTPAARTFRLGVLPFDNLSAAEDQFFTEGVARDINARLARVAGFTVLAHGSAERLHRSGTPYPQIADTLKLDYLVDGSVTRAADRFRITVNLVDPRTHAQIWSNQYDREITIANLLEAQSDIASQVARALDITLDPVASVTRGVQPGLPAYREYQLGRFHAARRTVASLLTAREHFQRAVALQPDYARAHAGLADINVLLPFFSTEIPARETLEQAAASAQRALQLDPALGEAETALGLVREFQFDWRAAEHHFRRGVALAPQYATAHHWYADMLARQRRFPEAIASINAALELDPVSPIINQDVGYVLTLAGRRAEGIEAYQRTVDLDPGFATTWMVLGTALLSERRFAEARRALDRFAQLMQRDRDAMTRLVDAVERYATTGIPQPQSASILNLAGPSGFARGHLLMELGLHDEALAWLEDGYRQGAPGIVMSVGSHVFEPVRHQPRFRALLRQAGLPE